MAHQETKLEAIVDDAVHAIIKNLGFSTNELMDCLNEDLTRILAPYLTNADEKPVYLHDFELIFSVQTHVENGMDVTAAELSAAVRKRADELDQNPNEWFEAVGVPFQSQRVG